MSQQQDARVCLASDHITSIRATASDKVMMAIWGDFIDGPPADQGAREELGGKVTAQLARADKRRRNAHIFYFTEQFLLPGEK
jgi:hypothetical protein